MASSSSDVPPPPAPAGPPRKRCPHDKRKDNCTICNPCKGGHGRVESRCGVCKGNVVEHDPATVPNGNSIWAPLNEHSTRRSELVRHMPAVSPDGKCNHTTYSRGAFRNYSNRRSCPVCSNCGHDNIKANCIDQQCSGCSHYKLKRNCLKCNGLGCEHGRPKEQCYGDRNCYMWPKGKGPLDRAI